MDITNFDDKIDQFKEKFEKVDGDFAQYSLDNGWVDEIADRNQYREIIAETVGWSKDKTTFEQVNYKTYLKAIKPGLALKPLKEQQIAIIHLKGSILDGHQKAGDIGGDSSAKLLQQARLDNKVKAVVLRIDSPGGSAFASEVIRKEIELLKLANKPVIASMSSVAASGGYWIASTADQIWASPSTITGSIGVFGMFMTFENTLDYLGIHADGVGSNEWAGFGVTKPLDEKIGSVLQRGVEVTYRNFLNLVAEHRNMTVEQVDSIAQGRVWTGIQAKNVGLVDRLGNMEQAIEAAAELAGLADYSTKIIEQELTEQEKLIQQILNTSSSYLDIEALAYHSDNKLLQLINKVSSEYDEVARLNDPRGVYTLCMACKF